MDTVRISSRNRKKKKKNQSELKNTMTEMKNALEELNEDEVIHLEISDLEDRKKEITSS